MVKMKHEKLKDICDFFGDGDWVEKKTKLKRNKTCANW